MDVFRRNEVSVFEIVTVTVGVDVRVAVEDFVVTTTSVVVRVSRNVLQGTLTDKHVEMYDKSEYTL